MTEQRPNEARIISVHGTFAAADSDHGKKWWQLESVFQRKLRSKLRSTHRIMGEGDVFHWSGENSERARAKAAADLLETLKPLESAKIDYHLVGHSHGGSVVWSTLKLATSRGLELKHLKSWSTVGTPFLHHKSRSPLNPISLTYLVLSLSLISPVARSLWFLILLVSGQLDQGLVINSHDDVNPIIGVIRAPFLELINQMGVPFETVENGIRLGSFIPGGDVSFSAYLLGTFEGWGILLAILLFAYLTLLLCSYCVAPVSEVLRNGLEKRLDQRTFQRYGGIWLGIWSKDDEAINGLKKTLELSVSFLGTLVPRDRIYISDFVSLPSRPLLRLFAPFYNRLLRPALDSKIRKLVIKTAQGNNRPAADVVAVSPHPIVKQANDSGTAIPRWFEHKMLHAADMQAQKLGPKLREFLGEATFSTGLEKVARALDSHTLVHTSYFEHAETVNLLALNIASSDSQFRYAQSGTNTDLQAWFVHFRNCQRSIMGLKPLQPVEPARRRLTPRRAA